MNYVVCIHLYIPWKFGEHGSTPRGARRPSLSVCLFVCPPCYDARHRKPRRCVYALNLGGMGISPPDSYSYHSNFRFRSSFRFRSRFRSRSNFRSSFSFSFRSRSSSSSTTSGDIFYCSGSRQLNHSSYYYYHYEQSTWVVLLTCIFVYSMVWMNWNCVSEPSLVVTCTINTWGNCPPVLSFVVFAVCQMWVFEITAQW